MCQKWWKIGELLETHSSCYLRSTHRICNTSLKYFVLLRLTAFQRALIRTVHTVLIARITPKIVPIDLCDRY